MTIVDKIESLKSYPQDKSERFREQLEKANQMGGMQQDRARPSGSQGMDRSREFSPVSRPSIVRSLTK